MLKTVLFAAAAAAATLATATPTLAKQVTVSYGDLDLATAKGQASLNRRINRAARAACEFNAEPRMPSLEAVRCFREAKARAKTEMATILDDYRLGG